MDCKDAAKALPERIETDTSLREERQKTDQQLATRSSVIEKDADQVLERARERADDVLEDARHKEDATTVPADQPDPSPAAVDEARASEDETLTEERAVADDQLSDERAEHRRAIAQLLELERKETDTRLTAEREHSDRTVASRDDFLAMVSHDVRGMLGVIATSAELLLALPARGSVGEATHTEARRIRKVTGQMNRLIGDLLDVVSMEMGRLDVNASREDAAALLAESIESFRVAAEARRLTMTCAAPHGPVMATFDRHRILQVLSNVLGNAIKFSEADGVIELGLARVPDGLEFTVRDRGRGIPPEDLEVIFERFSQGGRPDRRGLGLGLYIARCIVEGHGGKIWAVSEPGEGSTFHFTIPTVAASDGR
jgi:signal transduction histidine kinase